MKLTREQRDNRDQLSARAAIDMAICGHTAGIAVDDARKAKKMLRRVTDILESMRQDFTITRSVVGITDVHAGKGIVRIIEADKLTK